MLGGVRGIGGLSGDIGGVRWDRGVGWGKGCQVG